MTKSVFVGLSTIDLVYEVDQFPSPDSKITAQSQSVYVGGPATNAAITFAHLGEVAILVTGVGQHALTALIRAELQKYTVDLVDLTPKFDDVPVVSAVAVNHTGQRNVISANTTRISIHSEQVRTKLLRSASILLVDGHYMRACQAWARAARECGIRVVLDGGSWKAGTDELLRYVDTAVCSADFRPPGCSGHDQVIEFLKSGGVREIAITAGSAPIRFTSESQNGVIPVPQVPVVDTMGAGDVLHGAYCYYVTQGLSFPDALREASKIASESCRYRGTRAWIRSK